LELSWYNSTLLNCRNWEKLCINCFKKSWALRILSGN